VLDNAAPPAISGIGRAFHVPGVLPGASETQLFLVTARGQPISITILREPQAQPRWFVSLSEFVDAGATQPPRDSLLWYRLACFLPAQLPRRAWRNRASIAPRSPPTTGSCAKDLALARGHARAAEL
jgi:hypothetical protein